MQTLNMQYLKCLIIFACLLETNLAGNSTTVYMVKPNFQRKTCADSVFMLKNVPTSLTCSSICASDVDCESFFYFHASLRCNGCKRAYSTDEQLMEAGEETTHYSIRDAKRYEYVGCYSVVCYSSKARCQFSERDMIQDITPEKCFRRCDGMVGATVWTIAIQMDSCFCELQYDTREFGCNEVCPGNREESCGGTDVVSVYQLV